MTQTRKHTKYKIPQKLFPDEIMISNKNHRKSKSISNNPH